MLLVSNFSEFNRSDKASALGVSIMGGHAGSGSSMQISEDDKGKILRLALDDALRKCLPKIDRFLAQRPRNNTPAAPTAAVASDGGAAPQPAPDVAKQFCPHCGRQVTGGAKFCPGCGERIGS
jgi:hypothetical protein